MRRSFFLKLTAWIFFTVCRPGIPALRAQHLDFSKDTISQADAVDAKNGYKSIIKSGKRKTERINLPVGKLKDIMDACAANNVSEVSVMIVTIRPNDLGRYRANNPGSTASDDELTGSQMLVFTVPRRAFRSAGTGGIRKSVTNNPLMVGLLAAGLVVLDYPLVDLPFGSENIYFSFGSICPPPTSCD